MKIGLVTWDYDPPRGGLGRAMQRLRYDLRALGHDVSLFLPSQGSSRFLFFWKLHGSLSAWISRERVSLLLFPMGPGGIFLLQKPKIPSIGLCYHAYMQQFRFVPGEYWKRIFVPFERRTLRIADRIGVYATDTKRALREEYRIPDHRITMLTQGFDVDAWRSDAPQKEEGLCVCVSRLDPRKGVSDLLRVWPEVEARSASAHLVIVGDGKERQNVDALMRICMRARLVPSLSSSELRTLVGSAELALCPSLLEGFGLAAAEALAAGTPVIARAAPGLRSLVNHGMTGFVVPIEHFPETISHLLSERNLLQEFSNNAKADMKTRFDAPTARKELQALLQSVCFAPT